MHHHKVANMNPFPGEDRVNNESLEVGDLVSMSSIDYYQKVLFCRPNYNGFKHL